MMGKRDNVRQGQSESNIPVVNEWTVYDKNNLTPQHIMARRTAFRKALEEGTEDGVKNASLAYSTVNGDKEVNEQKKNDQIKCENQKLIQHIEKVRCEQRNRHGGFIGRLLHKLT